jgi:hypothetical protein
MRKSSTGQHGIPSTIIFPDKHRKINLSGKKKVSNLPLWVENARFILAKLMHVQMTDVFDAPVAVVVGGTR